MSRFQARLDATNSTSTPMRLVFGLRVSSGASPFVEAGRAWEEANGGRYYKAFGGEVVAGQGGNGEVVASR